MLNIGFSRLPHDWKYAAWIDCDVVFARPDWALETVHQLQHFNVVQMYSHMYDLAPDYTPAPQFYRGVPISYGYNHSLNVIADNRKPTAVDYFGGLKPQHLKSGFYEHPGFAWAITRESYNHLGGLIDWMPVGGADALMAICLTSSRDLPVWALTGNQGRWLLSWRDRCDKYIRGNVGCVPGLLLHNWHGRKAQRQYKDRWKIMTDNNYDPEIDLKRDSQGLWQLTDRSPKLKNDIRNYFRARNEDSIDVE
jgi:hypothetical protein